MDRKKFAKDNVIYYVDKLVPVPGFDPDLVEIRRKRFSTTQGEVEIFYNGRRLEQYGDKIELGADGWEGQTDAEWIQVAMNFLAVESMSEFEKCAAWTGAKPRHGLLFPIASPPRVIQIATVPGTDGEHPEYAALFALSEDGTIWRIGLQNGDAFGESPANWKQLPALPETNEA